MTHHPHIHMIVPGGGLSADGSKWISSRKRYFLPVPVLSRLFRRLFLKMLVAVHASGCLRFFGDHAGLVNSVAFARFLRPLRKVEWITYAKEPFAGPKSVLAYLSRYTHRVAISNSRLIKADETGVTFKYKDYRMEGPGRYKSMTLGPHEFIRRFLMHVLPKGFHRIRHYGLFASGNRAANVARARELLCAPLPPEQPNQADAANAQKPEAPDRCCPSCGSRMIVIELFARGSEPQYRPSPEGIDSS